MQGNKMNKLFWVICLFGLTFSNISFSEDTELLENVPPPPSISYDSSDEDEPEITIIKRDGEFIEEYRVNGQLYLMKVTPKNMPSYYLYKNALGAAWTRYEDIDPVILPQWVILTF